MKAIVAALHFIVNGAAKYDVSSETLETELQQLGLPKGACVLHFGLFVCSRPQVGANLVK